jgi:glycerol-3-phosphate acyltransferase PlsY
MSDIFSWFNVAAIIAAYLFGSIPSAVWVGKWFFGTDVREHGSKNAGATNTFRVLGKKAGIPVLFFDIFKGWAAVKGLSLLSSYDPFTAQFVNFQLAVGMAAVFGHIFPVYVRFKGGKGVATLLGIIIAIHYKAALLCFGIFAVTFLSTHYVSLAAIASAVSFPFLITVVFRAQTPSLIYFSIVIAVLVLFTHIKNIERLLKREENKMRIKLKFRNKN